MAGWIFLDKNQIPSEQMIADVLGSSSELWNELKSFMINNYGQFSEDWKFYSVKSGWTLKLLYKKRNMFFFAPKENHFSLTFIFGDKAVAKIEQSKLPQTIITELVNAKKYMEGRGINIDIKTKKDLKNAILLSEIKYNN